MNNNECIVTSDSDSDFCDSGCMQNAEFANSVELNFIVGIVPIAVGLACWHSATKTLKIKEKIYTCSHTLVCGECEHCISRKRKMPMLRCLKIVSALLSLSALNILKDTVQLLHSLLCECI